MIRSQKAPLRPVHNPASANELIQSSTAVGNITSYIGKILTINHHQVLVEQILGQGGFAFVFLVRSYNQQRYALKRMYVNNQRDLHVCQREISILKELSFHPNIVKYVDSYIQRLSYSRPNRDDNDDDGIHEILLLTEYCLNGTLITHLNEQRSVGIKLNERQILRIFADICNAVSACHSRRPQPILHRDIKLENILIDSHRTHVLCDFGSAIMLSSSTTGQYQQYQSNQLTTTVIQQLEEEIQRYTTLAYRAPEMIDLYSRLPITLKADIWAMGCLLYKLMYNAMPFGDSILAIQNGVFVIPDDMSHDYSRDLNLLVRYMLEIDINQRPDIWQVSYITYKLLGLQCPIPNQCQSKIPNLNTLSMPLTETESRNQRAIALSKAKSTPTNVIDESLSLGTAVNPRERPRGMAPSASLINFNQTTQQTPTVVVPPPPSSNPSRSGSAAQLMFDDDFSQIPSHAISLTNIPTGATSEGTVSRARPSPPATVSATSGLALQQQLFPPPPSSSLSSVYFHRRSSSQTLSPTNTQSSFQKASSVDSSIKQQQFICITETSDNELKIHNYSTENVKSRESLILNEDDQFKSDDEHTSSSNSDDDETNKSISPKDRKTNKNSQLIITSESKAHHPSTEEAEINHVSPDTNNGFDQLINEDSDDEERSFTNPTKISSDPTTKLFYHFTTIKRPLNEHNNQINSSFIDNNNNNPFLQAPFHHSSVTKQLQASINVDMTKNNTNLPHFDSDSIVIGTKLSAFTPYQKQQSNSDNNVVDTTNNSVPHTKSFPSDILNNQSSPPSNDVFANAPFKAKLRNKQRSIETTKVDTISSPSSSQSTSSSNSQLIDLIPQEQSNSKAQQYHTSPSRRAVGSAGLATNFVRFASNNSNDIQDFHSSNEELTSSSSSSQKGRNRNKKKMIPDIEPEQHAYANLSFNDAIVDEFF